MFLFCCIISTLYRYNNRKKSFWKFLYIAMLGLMLGRYGGTDLLVLQIELFGCILTHFLLFSLACTAVFFMASYENYPSGYALKPLHRIGERSLYVLFTFFWDWHEPWTAWSSYTYEVQTNKNHKIMSCFFLFLFICLTTFFIRKKKRKRVEVVVPESARYLSVGDK